MKYFFLFMMIFLLSVGVSLGCFARRESALGNTRTGKNSDSIFWQSNANNTVPVDGISFETVVSEPVLKIPENRARVCTPIHLGIRITNNTSEPVRFSRLDLTPEFINFKDELLSAGVVQYMLVVLGRRNFPLVLPKESSSLFWEGCFFWDKNMLLLILDDINNGRCGEKTATANFTKFNKQIIPVHPDLISTLHSLIASLFRGNSIKNCIH